MSPAGVGEGRSPIRTADTPVSPAGVLLLVATFLLAVLPGCGGQDEMTIIVISMDTTRPDHLTPYGYDKDTTPTLARLAREGVVFTEARTTAPWTLPSHMSLFTGQPPGVHNVVIDFLVLDPSRPTMGEIFAEADFATAGFFTAPYVHGRYGFDRGFDIYQRMLRNPTVFDIPADRRAEQQGRREALSHREVTSDRVIGQARTQLKRTSRPRNLLFLHLFDPHYDYMAPPQFVDAFVDPKYAGPVDGNAPTGRPDVIHADMPADDEEHFKALYDAELAWVDACLGQLLQGLEKQGRLDTTLIVVTADHGEEFFEHGRFGHRAHLYDEVLRVPMLFWAPGRIPGGQSFDTAVSLCDVLPTLMDYAGIEADPRHYGRSLLPLMEGTGTVVPRPSPSALSFFPAKPEGYYVLHEGIVHHGMKVVRRTRIAWSPEREQDLSGAPVEEGERIEVYDLAADPGEEHNLAESTPDDPRVRGAIEAFDSARLEQLEIVAQYQDVGVAMSELSLRETMQAFGYTDSQQPGEDR